MAGRGGGARPGIRAVGEPEVGAGTGLDPATELMDRVARGDEEAFAGLYDLIAGKVFGIVLRVVRDPARSEEVTQEVFTELWQTATRYDASRGSAAAWAITLAHRRAVDCVRSENASAERERRVGTHQGGGTEAYDQVAEQVIDRIERESVRRCLDSLTQLQREAVTLAYYAGYTYPEVATLLKVALATVKSRMRDGLIRLRDCLGSGGAAGPAAGPVGGAGRAGGAGVRGSRSSGRGEAGRPEATGRGRDV